jgi:two-component system sensor histidine kinase PilS (NtrC family)
MKEHIARDSASSGTRRDEVRDLKRTASTSEGMRLRLGYSISPLSSESGETTGMVITFQDLTQVRSLEETSRRQDRLAAIGRMAASIAHEIRNPLAAMRGSIQMLRSEMKAIRRKRN